MKIVSVALFGKLPTPVFSVLDFSNLVSGVLNEGVLIMGWDGLTFFELLSLEWLTWAWFYLGALRLARSLGGTDKGINRVFEDHNIAAIIVKLFPIRWHLCLKLPQY